MRHVETNLSCGEISYMTNVEKSENYLQLSCRDVSDFLICMTDVENSKITLYVEKL